MTVYTRHQSPPAAADPQGPAGLWMPWYTGLGDVCNPCPIETTLCSEACSGKVPSHIEVDFASVIHRPLGCSGYCQLLNAKTWELNYSRTDTVDGHDWCLYLLTNPATDPQDPYYSVAVQVWVRDDATTRYFRVVGSIYSPACIWFGTLDVPLESSCNWDVVVSSSTNVIYTCYQGTAHILAV
jgi:hypothetical protein